MSTPIRFAAQDVTGADIVLANNPHLGAPWTPQGFAELYTEVTDRYDVYRSVIDRRQHRSETVKAAYEPRWPQLDGALLTIPSYTAVEVAMRNVYGTAAPTRKQIVERARWLAVNGKHVPARGQGIGRPVSIPTMEVDE